MVGDAWEEQKISVATEHYITHFLRQRLLMWMIGSPPPQNIPPIVLACAPNEYHEGSLLMLGALLRRRLLPVAYLGQSVPLPDLATFIRVTKPKLVVIVAMTENSANEMIDWPSLMPEVSQSNLPLICFGGKVFDDKPEWRSRIPGIFLGTTIQQGLEHIRQLSKQLCGLKYLI